MAEERAVSGKQRFSEAAANDMAQPGISLDAIPTEHLLVHLSAPALADRCVCLVTPALHSHQLIARCHLFSGPPSTHLSAPFGCPLHPFKLQHTLDEHSDRWSLYLHYDSDGFPRTGQRCAAVHVEIVLKNSKGDELARRELRRAFTPRAAWGWPSIISITQLRTNPQVAEDGLVGVEARVVLAENARATDPDPLVWDAFRKAKLWTDGILIALPEKKSAMNGSLNPPKEAILFDATEENGSDPMLSTDTQTEDDSDRVFHVHRILLSARSKLPP